MACKSYLKTLLTWTVLTGCFVISLPMGLEWYYGNLSTYTNSYFRNFVGDTAYDIGPNWLLPTLLVFYVIGIVMIDLLARTFDMRLIQLVCIFVFHLSIFLTYFTIQHSVGLTLITFMMCTGYTSGVVNTVSMKYASQVLPNRPGLVTAVVTMSYGAGAIFYNYIITYYINPDNLTPEIRETNEIYFGQAKLLDKVPGVFIVMAIVGLALGLLGYVFELFPFFVLNKLDNSMSSDANELTQITRTVSMDRKPHQTSNSDNANNSFSSTNNAVSDSSSAKLSVEQVTNLKPNEVLRTRTLYQLWICMSVLTYCLLLNLNSYKELGQLWIKDDEFLASIGSFSSVSSCLFRVPFGILTDKIGVKNSLIMTMSLNSILLTCWYITVRLNRWFYFIICQLVIPIQGTLFMMAPTASMKYYGPKFFATNYGLVMVSMVATSLACPTLFSVLQDSYGWLSMVLFGSISSTLALISVVLFMPKDR